MKKILLFVALFMTIFSTAHADSVRIADVGAESLVNTIQTRLAAENLPLVISKVMRVNAEDVPNLGLSGYGSAFGRPDQSDPDGYIAFLVNGEGYVSAAKIVQMNSSAPAREIFLVLTSLLMSAGVNLDEIKTLANSREVLQDGSAASVWCSSAQRRFIVMERDNSKVFMILASDKR